MHTKLYLTGIAVIEFVKKKRGLKKKEKAMALAISLMRDKSHFWNIFEVGSLVFLFFRFRQKKDIPQKSSLALNFSVILSLPGLSYDPIPFLDTCT